MPTAPYVDPLVLRGPDAIPALIPHLVGFHPAASLVLLGLAEGSHLVRVTLRFDLPPAGVAVTEVVDEWSVAVGALTRADALETVLAVYPSGAEDPWCDGARGELPRRELVDALVDELADAGVRTLDALCVVGTRMRSYQCTDPRCCPAEGRVVAESESLRVGASLVARGSAPFASRRALVSSLDPRASGDPVALAVATERRLLDPVRWGAEEVDSFCVGLGVLADSRMDPMLVPPLAALGEALCARITSRDLLLRALSVDAAPEALPAARAVLGEAVRCARGVDVAPAASVLAVCAWVMGDGAAARVALDRALAADPAYSLAGLVAAALDAATPPWTWVAMMRDLSVETILGAELSPDDLDEGLGMDGDGDGDADTDPDPDPDPGTDGRGRPVGDLL
jgi:Domain of unknown function (DUF4192)